MSVCRAVPEPLCLCVSGGAGVLAPVSGGIGDEVVRPGELWRVRDCGGRSLEDTRVLVWVCADLDDIPFAGRSGGTDPSLDLSPEVGKT